jgi:hypothetical protein
VIGSFDLIEQTTCSRCGRFAPLLVKFPTASDFVVICPQCVEDMQTALLVGPLDGNEVWKAIPDHEGYEISTLGRVRSWHLKGSPTKYVKEPWLLKTTPLASTGYPTVCLSGRNGRQSSIAVHRLMARTFLGKPKRGQVCRHLDDNKTNNKLWNLSWGTQRDNVLDAFRNGTRNGDLTKKLTREQALEALQSNETAVAVAKRFGVSHSAINDIRNGKTWKELPRAQ